MPFAERATDSSKIRYWPGSIPLQYKYTAGVAGQRFLTELKDNGRITAPRCSKCKKAYLPPRLFCDNCFIRMQEWIEVRGEPFLYSWTISRRRRDGSMGEAQIIGLVRFKGVEGGLVHLIRAENQRKLRIGVRLKPVLREESERTGSMRDIECFRLL